MYLSLQFDYIENSTFTLEELSLHEESFEQQTDNAYFGFGYSDYKGIGGWNAFSRLYGKRLILPLPKSKSGLWGFEKDDVKEYADFIIGIEDSGKNISHTSNPKTLADYFGNNPDAPNYLTPVDFRKQVLDKYFQEPSKYSISSGLLRCGSLWGLQIDNHHENKVTVWLGDLGRDLSYEEQLYWRSFNIPPQGTVSNTYFQRQLMAEPKNSDQVDHAFHALYKDLATACRQYLGWQLLLPLNAADAHHLQSLRIPATNEQREFDSSVLSLTKILIDSLNEKHINTLIANDKLQTLKSGIAKLELLFNEYEINGKEHILFLRELQTLRSSSAAHRKGSNYIRIANQIGLESQTLRSAFTQLLERSNNFLTFLLNIVEQSHLKESSKA